MSNIHNIERKAQVDLIIDNKINGKDRTDNEIKLFIKELSEELNRKQNNSFSTTICNEIYNEIPLANIYKNDIENLVNRYMIDMSYSRDFLYYDYDASNKLYYFDYYSNGEKHKIEIPKEEIEIMGKKTGTFWKIYDEEKIVGADYIKDNIKINIESELKLMNDNLKK